MEALPGPLLRTVLCMDQVTVAALLQHHVALLQPAQALEQLHAQWLFALSAALEKPAHSDVVSALRSLLRRAAVLRAGLARKEDPQLPRLNTLAAVAGAYFGQDEKLVGWVADLELP